MLNSFEVETQLKQDTDDYPYAGDMIFVVVSEGELVYATYSGDEAEGRANYINEDNVDTEIRRAGYDPDDITPSKYREFQISAGYNSGCAYYDRIDIPDEYELEDYAETSKGDSFTYADLFDMLEHCEAMEEEDEEFLEDWEN